MVWGALPPQQVILRPRPLQRNPGSILLVPLLPYRKTATPLPTEIWTGIFVNAYYGDDDVDPTPNVRRRAEKYRRDLLLVCRALTVCSTNPAFCVDSLVDGLLTSSPRTFRRTSPFPYSTPVYGSGRFGNWIDSRRRFMLPINGGIHFEGYHTPLPGDGSKTSTCLGWIAGVWAYP